MKKWNWSKIMQAILLLIGAIGGTAYGLETAGVIDLNPEPVQVQSEPLAAVPGAPVSYTADVVVIWKKTNTALPDAQYLAVTHRISLPTAPNIGSAFNVVRDSFVNGKIKAPVDDFVPVYGYSVVVVSRSGKTLAEPPGKTTPPTPETK